MRAIHLSFLLACTLSQQVSWGQCIAPWCNPGGVIQESEGTTTLESYFSSIHSQNIQYKIYLPRDYAVETDRQYPLILLLPGYGSTEVYTDYFVQLVGRMAQGTFPRSVLVVLNPIGNAFWHDASQSTGTSTPVQGYSTVINEMIPHLEANYRVGTAKANRALVGFSMGGYGALNLALRSNMFSSATAFDAALRLPGNESPQLQYSCYNVPAQITQNNLFTVLSQNGSNAQQTFLHLLVSTNGNADQAQFHNQLTSIGAAHRFEDVTGTAHAWADFFAVRADTTVDVIMDHLVVPSSNIVVNVKAMLQGPFNPASGAMSSSLGTGALLPAAEPYTGTGYTHVGGGGETAAPAVLQASGAASIADWVVLELRDKNDAAHVLGTRSALLRNDGMIVDTDGAGPVSFALPQDNYFVAVRHRNHLGIMSTTAVPITSSTPLLDLTQVANIHDGGLDAAVNVSGRWCLWAGDVIGDGELKYIGSNNDRDPVLVAIGGVLPTNTVGGYHAQDINLDGVVKYVGPDNDRDPILVNVGGTVPTNTRSAKLP